ncbi:tenascin-N [Corythoichthys intestinalis]|uniref:tenascin-N n=1 Tax=Corythoichthys intestinalis TaxID=161448 RepID=UPI0025A50843|nr:tenascin-N [Corythoichthys intestinalis]
MTAKHQWRGLLVLLCIVSQCSFATKVDSSTHEQAVTFIHVYNTDVPGGSDCKLEHPQSQDEKGLQMETTPTGENNVIFRHKIRLQSPTCDCAESESFKSLLYRVNGLEEEVNYLKSQCAQGCCGSGGAVDTSCSGHGTYQEETCSCQCYPGWEGPDCSISSCPDECNDNGRCVDRKCVCYQGYTGEDCSEEMCPDNCNDKGRCVDGKCVCFPHFTGDDCSVQKCPNDCSRNGLCVNGQCVCDQGFYGEDCSLALSPQGLRLVQATDISLLVQWLPVAGADYYVLTYHPRGQGSALKQVRVPNMDNSYLITGLTSGLTYFVEVHAVVKGIQSGAEEIEATTVVSAVSDIRVLDRSDVSIQVDWSNPQAEVDYFRLTHIDPSGQEEELNVQKSQEARTKHTIVGLYPGTEYLIAVQAIKGPIEGNASSVIGSTDIDAPANLITTQVTEDTAMLSWDPVQAHIEGYMLTYTSDAGSSGEIPVGRDMTSYRLVGLKPGVVYTINIWAFSGDKVSRKSFTTAETELDAPSNILAHDETESSFRVSWESVQAEIDGYVLKYRSPDGSSEEIPVGPHVSTYTISGLRPGVVYTVRIWAVKGDKASRKVSTQAETGLDAPTNFRANDETESSVRVSWDGVQAEIEGYVLTYTSSEGSSGEISLGPDATSYSLTGLRPGVIYTVYIWAIKGNKVSRKVSTQAETELDDPANPLTQDQTESSFRVSWEGVQAEIDGYVLTHSSSEGSSGEIRVGAESNSYSLSGLRPGVVYTVYIWAVKGGRSSRKISVQAETEIDTPRDLRALSVTTESAMLTWTAPLADIEGYILTYRDEDGNMETVEKQLRARETSFAISGLLMGKRYIVSIIAYRGNKRSKVVETSFKTVGLLHPYPMDCFQIMKNGFKKSGIYTVYINNVNSNPIEAYCDMDTDGGGWLVLQRRTTGKLDFMKRWRQYAAGFGNMTDEFWIGLDKIYQMTNTPIQYEVRFDLGLGSERAYAVYDSFKIASARQKFALTIGSYRGTAGDAMTYHQGRPWTTIDSDNDIALGNCALTHRGAWWYKNCHLANINGKWGDNRHSLGVNWEPWKGHLVSLDFTEMKIRPVGSYSSRKRRSLKSQKIIVSYQDK